MNEFYSAGIEGRFQIPLVALVTCFSIYGTLLELRRRNTHFARAFILYALFGGSFAIYGWLRGSGQPFFERFNDTFGAYVMTIVPGLMLYIRNAGFIRSIVPLWAYFVIGAVNLGCAVLPYITRVYESTEDDKLVNHHVTAGFICVFISLWALAQLPFEQTKFKRRLCLLFGLISYLGALGYLAKYLVWYYVFFPVFYIQVLMLISATRKIIVRALLVIIGLGMVSIIPKLTILAVQNRSAETRNLEDYIEYKVTRDWLDTDYKVFGLSDGGRLALWTEYFIAYEDTPLLGTGFGFRASAGIMEHSFPLFIVGRTGALGWAYLLVYIYYFYQIWKFFEGYHPRIRRMARLVLFFVNLTMCFTTIYAEVYILVSFYAYIGTMLARERIS